MKKICLSSPWIWAPIILVVDFITKRLVLANADVLRGKVDVIGDFLRFTYVRNPGAAMGLFPIGQKILVSVSIAASVFLIYLYWRSRPDQVLRRFALAAILGGALGNLIDRIFYDGRVVDFIDIGIGDARFYTFNVADMGVTIGGVLLLLCFLRGDGKEEESTAAFDPVDTTAATTSPVSSVSSTSAAPGSPTTPASAPTDDLSGTPDDSR